jgi:hypothetical protein
MNFFWLVTSERMDYSMSVPICFWMTSFFCLMRWIRTMQS